MPVRRALPTGLLTLGLLATAAPAAAAPPWSAPRALEPQARDVSAPTLAFAAGEQPGQAPGLVSFGRSDQPGLPDDRAALVALPSGSARPVKTLGAPPEVYAQTRAVYARTAELSRTPSGLRRVLLGASFGRTAGTVGRLRPLDRDVVLAGPPSISANRRGQVALAWIERRESRDLLWLAQRPTNRGFGRPAVIRAGGRMADVDVTVGDGGDLVVAYAHSERIDGELRRVVEARVRRAGFSLGRVQAVGRQAGLTDIDTAMAPNGRTVIAWGTQDGGEEAGEPWVVRAVVRPAGPRVFRNPQVLDPGGSEARPRGEVAAATAPDGAATVAWSGVRRAGQGPTGYPVFASTTDRQARFRQPQLLDGSGAVGDVAVGPQGTALVTWSRIVDAEPTQIFAALRPRDASAYGPPEEVSAAGAAGEPAAAWDPRAGTPAIVWAADRAAGDRTQTVLLARRTG